MKASRLISTVIMITLCLSGLIQQARAQHPSTASSKTDRYADEVSILNPSNLLARVWRGKRAGFGLMPSRRYSSMSGMGWPIAPTADSPPAVHGTGTVGRISMWSGTGPSGRSILGDSIITQLSDNIGIGLDTPLSKLAVRGMIETTLGGYKFPDGTVQTTAAVSGLQTVSHDSTLRGDGTAGSPLGVEVPLQLIGASDISILVIENNDPSGAGAFIAGGSGSNSVRGGIGVDAKGGSNFNGFIGGIGLRSFGGNVIDSIGGVGVHAVGGSSNRHGGSGVIASGGRGDLNVAGSGVIAFGGNSQSRFGGIGVEATGGDSGGNEPGGTGVRAVGGGAGGDAVAGIGVEATGGGSDTGGPAGAGVQAKGGDSAGFGGNGVVATGGDFNGRGVFATGGVGPVGYGVEARGGSSTGPGGVAGAGIKTTGGASSGSNSASGTGILAIAGEATNNATRGRAGIFEGDVSISEHLTAGSLDVAGTKNFKIDHPLDPENKYLLHAAIESSEVLNVYSGNIITDAKGEAVITLPQWFEVLNRDHRYQLTVIGTFAQAIVAAKVKQNRFMIRTSAPNVEVSWQVTGVRSDARMRKHPFKAEESKPERERGSYINPEAFGKPEELGVEWARNPEMMRQLKQHRASSPAGNSSTARPHRPKSHAHP